MEKYHTYGISDLWKLFRFKKKLTITKKIVQGLFFDLLKTIIAKNVDFLSCKYPALLNTIINAKKVWIFFFHASTLFVE